MLLFLVVGIPMGIYWASHGFEAPGDNLSRFAGELAALGGPPPPEPEEAPASEEPETPEEKPEPKPPERAKSEPTPPTPPPPPSGPELNAREKAQKLFDEGRFAEAAAAFVGIDERLQTRAQLGAAFAVAFPPRIPERPYVVIRTGTGGEFEGFAERTGDSLRLTSAAGRSLSFPIDSIATQREIARDEALDRLAKRIGIEGTGVRTKGSRLFALIQEAFSIGRPAAAGPLLPRALELDEEKPFFLSSVRNRVGTEHQAALYRAFADCMVSPEDIAPTETIAQAPRKLGGDRPPKPRKPGKSSIKSSKARELVAKAKPMRQKGIKLYRKVFTAGLKDASSEDIAEAIRLLDKAADLYEKALEHEEDSGEIYALLRHCSKHTFQLRFWQEQVDGR